MIQKQFDTLSTVHLRSNVQWRVGLQSLLCKDQSEHCCEKSTLQKKKKSTLQKKTWCTLQPLRSKKSTASALPSATAKCSACVPSMPPGTAPASNSRNSVAATPHSSYDPARSAACSDPCCGEKEEEEEEEEEEEGGGGEKKHGARTSQVRGDKSRASLFLHLAFCVVEF